MSSVQFQWEKRKTFSERNAKLRKTIIIIITIKQIGGAAEKKGQIEETKRKDAARLFVIRAWGDGDDARECLVLDSFSCCSEQFSMVL